MEEQFFVIFREKQLRNKLQNLIINKKVNISKFTKSLGITRSTLYRYMNGSREFDIDIVVKIAEILEVELKDVVGQKCLICGEYLPNNVYTTDRLGLNTNKRKRTHRFEKNTLIYDCQKCGYIAFNHEFLEDINDIMLSTAREYYALYQTVSLLRSEISIPWHDIILFESVILEDEMFIKNDFTAIVNQYLIDVSITYNPENRNTVADPEADMDVAPKEFSIIITDSEKNEVILEKTYQIPEIEDNIDL